MGARRSSPACPDPPRAAGCEPTPATQRVSVAGGRGHEGCQRHGQTCRVTTATSASSGLAGSDGQGGRHHHRHMEATHERQSRKAVGQFSRLDQPVRKVLYLRGFVLRTHHLALQWEGFRLLHCRTLIGCATNLEPMTSVLQQHLVVPEGWCGAVSAAVTSIAEEVRRGGHCTHGSRCSFRRLRSFSRRE